jgi:hypothetical protein
MEHAGCINKVLVIWEQNLGEDATENLTVGTHAMSSGMTAAEIIFLLETYKAHLISLITKEQGYDQD